MSTDIFGIKSVTGSDPYGIGKGSHLRSCFNSFVDKHPMWLVYVRRDERFPCKTHYDTKSLSPDTTCETCFGTGYRVQFEKHKCRRVVRAQEVQSPIEPYGYLDKYKAIVYTPRYYYPTSKDLYLEVEWDVNVFNIEHYGKPSKVLHAFQVDEAVGFSEDEVTYMACGCDTYGFNSGLIEFWTLRLGQVWKEKRVI